MTSDLSPWNNSRSSKRRFCRAIRDVVLHFRLAYMFCRSASFELSLCSCNERAAEKDCIVAVFEVTLLKSRHEWTEEP